MLQKYTIFQHMQQCCIKYCGKGVLRRQTSVKSLLDLLEQADLTESEKDFIEGLKLVMDQTTVDPIFDSVEEDGILQAFMNNDGSQWYA